MAKGAKPTKYTKEVWDKICDRLSDGESLRHICQDEDMPNKAAVFKWLRTKTDIVDQYARAKQESADAMAEDLLAIADEGVNDWMERHYGETTVWVENGEALGRSRLRVDTRKWLMSKMKPKKYGEKLELSGDDTAPLSIIVKLPGDKPS